MRATGIAASTYAHDYTNEPIIGLLRPRATRETKNIHHFTSCDFFVMSCAIIGNLIVTIPIGTTTVCGQDQNKPGFLPADSTLSISLGKRKEPHLTQTENVPLSCFS